MVAAPADTSQPVNETEEQTKTVQELMDEGVESLSKAKYAEAAELFSLAVEKLYVKHSLRVRPVPGFRKQSSTSSEDMSERMKLI